MIAWWSGLLVLQVALVARAEPPSPEVDDPKGAEESPWWLGLPVAGVQFSAPEGGLPEESLSPLLRVAQGEPLDPHLVGLDLATLYQVNEFSAVEAQVEPMGIEDPRTGEPVRAVTLTYVVHPAPKVAALRIQGNKKFRGQELLAESGLARGQVFYAELDGPFAEQRLEKWLASRGYTKAQVQIRSTEPSPGQIHLVILVDEGVPNTLDRLTFTGDLDGVATERQLRRWCRKKGVAEGRPLAPTAIADAQESIREHLGTLRGGLLGHPTAWIESRVTPLLIRTPDGPRVTFAIEHGTHLELDVEGLGYNGEHLVEQALAIDYRLRITRGFLDQAPDKVTNALQEQGWLDASVQIPPPDTSDPKTERLQVLVDRGARHTIGGVFDFQLAHGGTAGQQAREKRELQAVFDQASPEVLAQNHYTVAEMQKGIAAATQYYVDRGYLDAKLALGDPVIEPRYSLGNVLRAIGGRPRNVRLTPTVRVDRGALTTLASLDVQGAAADVDLGFVAKAPEAKVGEPFSPQKLDALAHRIVDVHRQAGYLEADAKVEHTVTGPHQRSSVIVVTPGTKLLLRSVLIRGTRVSKPSFVLDEVPLALGEPVTSTALDQIRSDLYDLGIFRSVDLRLLGDEDARDLVITLDERPRWEFEFGPGVSTDQGFRAIGRATRNNLFGTAQSLQLLGQIGFAFRSDNVSDWLPDLTDPEWRGALSYTAPRFPFDRTKLVVDVLLRERTQERTWQMDRTGGGASLEADLGRTRLQGGFRVEARQLNQLDAGVLLPGEPWYEAFFDDTTGSVELDTHYWRWQEAVTGLAVYDARDDKLAPQRGFLMSWNSEWVPGLPWDDLFEDQTPASFIKNDLRFSGYEPLGGFTLHVGLGGGYISSFAGVPPLEDRYRLGGTGSFRGFVRDAVGPQNIAPPIAVDWPQGIGPVIDYAMRDNAERWVPTGGDASAVGTVELLMPLPALGLTSWEGYSAEVFSDFGNVWLASPDTIATSETREYASQVPPLRWSFGAGFRMTTPVGPMQVDIAINPQVLFASPGSRVRGLLVDGWQEPPVRAHLALGAL